MATLTRWEYLTKRSAAVDAYRMACEAARLGETGEAAKAVMEAWAAIAAVDDEWEADGVETSHGGVAGDEAMP